MLGTIIVGVILVIIVALIVPQYGTRQEKR